MSIQKYCDEGKNLNYINNIIEILQKGCGIGYRAAQKVLVQMLQDKTQLLQMSNALRDLHDKSRRCLKCNNIDVNEICSICADETRDMSVICVVESIIHMIAIEKSGSFNGIYHILYSPNQSKHRITINTDAIDHFAERLLNEAHKIKEVVLAFDGSLNGEVMIHYILDIIPQHNIKVTRPASGVPVGADLEHVDANTLGIAINTRQEIKLSEKII